eukprot:COSAG06_NODE_3021_length_5950_cov_3.010938_10_plen_84_part_00
MSQIAKRKQFVSVLSFSANQTLLLHVKHYTETSLLSLSLLSTEAYRQIQHGFNRVRTPDLLSRNIFWSAEEDSPAKKHRASFS